MVMLLSPPPFRTPFLSLHSIVTIPCKIKIRTLSICNCNNISSNNGEASDWRRWVPRKLKLGPDKVLESIAAATSSPISQFISSPTTFLHLVDPRIKLVWLLVLVFLPARSHIYMRFVIVLSLAALSTWILPKDVWTDQLSRVTFLSLILFVVLGLTADGVLPGASNRTPPPSLNGLPSIPSSFRGYTYVLFKFGPLQMTRKGLSVASTSACLTFTLRKTLKLDERLTSSSLFCQKL